MRVGDARSGRRLDSQRLQGAQEAPDRAPGAGHARVRRAEVGPRHRRRSRGREEAAARRRRADQARRARTVPMGYLFCGPVGTGKSFLATCVAGSIGIPGVVLKNFRSKYVGETEGNLERVLACCARWGRSWSSSTRPTRCSAIATRAATPASSRVFGMIASQMGDTRYRGKILWMLLTARPDLLPIDLKRQGRAEVHIPLFYPTDQDELRRCSWCSRRSSGRRSRRGRAAGASRTRATCRAPTSRASSAARSALAARRRAA